MSCVGNLAPITATLLSCSAIEVGQLLVIEKKETYQGDLTKLKTILFPKDKEDEARAAAAYLVASRSGPVDPTSEIARKALAARASIVASPVLDKTELTTVCGSGADDLLKDDSAPPASSFALADKCPIVKLLFDASESPSAFRAFLDESVDVSCEPARRELVRKTEERSIFALERFLRTMLDGPSMAVRLGGRTLLDEEALLCILLDIEVEVKSRPLAAPGALSAPGTLGKPIEILLGNLDTSGSQEEKLERGAFRDAARAICGNVDALRRLQSLRDLVRKQEFPELVLKCSGETCMHSQLLFLSAVKDPYAALQGVLPDKETALVCDVRAGLDSRLLTSLFPDKQFFSERQTKAIQGVRVGRLLEVSLMGLLDIGEGGSAEDPLGCFASLGAEAETRFAQAISLMGEAVSHSLSEPKDVVSCMLFFRHFSELFIKYRGRGASWSMLSKLYYAVMHSVQKPAVAFSRGGMGDVGGASVPSLLDLSLALFASNSEPRVKIEQELVDEWMASRTPLRALQPDFDRSKGAGKTSWLAPAKWSAACSALQEGVPPVQSQSGDELDPCRKFFIMGKCERGDDCPFHHEGEAGAYAPQ
jgi:hypothetical protein